MNERFPCFLNAYNNFEKNYLTADFSPRKYFRWVNGKTSYVLMDCNDLVSLNSFIKVDEFLISNGLSAPKIIEADLASGFLLLEDFGDNTFTKVLKENPKSEYNLYKSAVELTAYLTSSCQEKPDFLPVYSKDIALNKISLFTKCYLPKILKKDCADIENIFLDIWKKPFELALSTKKSVFLRDYHVDNLMELNGRKNIANIGLLDFQDALWAPVAGDLVSLLDDARRTVPKEIKKEMWKLFLEKHHKGDREEIYIAGNIISAIRQLKIIGLFTKVAIEKGNKKFFGRIPYLWEMLNECCEIYELTEIKNWLNNFVPCNLRTAPEI